MVLNALIRMKKIQKQVYLYSSYYLYSPLILWFVRSHYIGST